MEIKLLPRDSSKHIIQAGTDIYIFSVSASSSAWTSIELPVDSKSVVIKARDTVGFKVSHEDGGDYITVNTDLALDIVAKAGTTIFYVQPNSDTTMEVLILR